MPSGSSVGVGVIALAVIVAGAGAGAHAVDATDTLENVLDEALDEAVRDVTVDWLDVVDAHGHVEEDRVRSVETLVRLDAPVESLDLDSVVVETNATTTDLVVEEVLRDEDASLEEGELTDGDLVRVAIGLEHGLEADATRTLTLHHPDARPLELEVETPRTFDGELVRLDVRTTW